MIAGTEDWQYFEPGDGSGIIGMEKMLDDGTAMDVLGYSVNGEVDEYSWMVRLWDDATQSYRNIASYDNGIYYNDLEEAYDGLIDHVKMNFSHLLGNDPIVTQPERARVGFLRKAMLCGLAAMISFSMIGMVGCSSSTTDNSDESSYASEQCVEYNDNNNASNYAAPSFDSIGASAPYGSEHLMRIDDGEHTELAYDSETLIVYYVFRDTGSRYGTGYMSPYISANGSYCKYVDGQIVELS